jgi:hypothetical protein
LVPRTAKPTPTARPTKAPNYKALLAAYIKAEGPLDTAICRWNQTVAVRSMPLRTAQQLAAADVAGLRSANTQLAKIKWPPTVVSDVTDLIASQAAEATQQSEAARALTGAEFDAAVTLTSTLNADRAAQERIVLADLGADPGQYLYRCY